MRTQLAWTLVTLTWLTSMDCRAQSRVGDVASAAEQALRQKLTTAYPTVTRWEIAPLPAATESTGPASSAAVTITVTRLGERSAVWVGSRTLGQHRHGSLLWFSVVGYATAVTAAHLLAAGTALDSQDGALVERDIVGSDCKAIDSPAALAGMRVRRLVRTGELLCASLLEPIPPVARGQEVTLRYAGRSFTLTARGVAQADGLLGKRVTVRNTSSGELLAATVTGNREVTVNE